ISPPRPSAQISLPPAPRVGAAISWPLVRARYSPLCGSTERAEGKPMRRAMAIAAAAALAACGSRFDFSQSCTMNVSVNGAAPAAVDCFAAGATTSGMNAVSIAMNGSPPGVSAAQFAMTLPSAPSAGTYGAGNVTTAAAQVQTTSGGIYSQSNVGS